LVEPIALYVPANNFFRWALLAVVWRSGSALGSINEVTLHRARDRSWINYRKSNIVKIIPEPSATRKTCSRS